MDKKREAAFVRSSFILCQFNVILSYFFVGCDIAECFVSLAGAGLDAGVLGGAEVVFTFGLA